MNIETCSTGVALCTIGAWVTNWLHPVVIILSFVWLSMQIYYTIKDRRKRK